MTRVPTDGERHQLGIAAHEAAHAVTAVLAGARISRVVMVRGGPRTNPGGAAGVCRYARQDDSLAAVVETQRHLITAAGSVAEAVWHHGPRPTSRQIDRFLDVNTRDRAELRTIAYALGEPPRPREVLPTVLRCWPAIAEVGRRLFTEGSASHTDVLRALGIAAEQDAPSLLAAIRNGQRPIPLREEQPA